MWQFVSGVVVVVVVFVPGVVVVVGVCTRGGCYGGSLYLGQLLRWEFVPRAVVVVGVCT